MTRKFKDYSFTCTIDKHFNMSEENLLSTDNNLDYKELDENLFNLGNEYAFAHCVAEDLQMGAGIAVEFKRCYGCVGKLFDQNLKVGDVGVLNHNNQFIFYLITKKYSNGKPTIYTLKQTLFKLLKKIKENNLTKLGIPKIGCGLDGLNWSDVENFIKDLFCGTGVQITVCVPSPSKITNFNMSQKALSIYTTPKNLWEMEEETDIILFLKKENLKFHKFDSTSDKIDAKYPFKNKLLRDISFQNESYVFQYTIANEKILCILERSQDCYDTIEKIFRQLIKEVIYKRDYRYYALQFEDPKKITKIIEIIRSVYRFGTSELWLCGIEDYPVKTYYDILCRNLRQNNFS
ncbi:uncharacterized protein LOC126904889 [Daktulosphaira vitifoliae]|uniref:uncharacterized protein LOC126904889 n=1 Tax=Daktulosphaira vitifoliae TaxID=58002 RepID=UPI0021A9A2E1|nr:uncharacterized protein LOC126904889 [Daktulosphaira vitifoliae]XP_050540189.1 uncharacterized protein LOC126904889 [Daktulosphaira vitifoliae]